MRKCKCILVPTITQISIHISQISKDVVYDYYIDSVSFYHIRTNIMGFDEDIFIGDKKTFDIFFIDIIDFRKQIIKKLLNENSN